MRAPSFEALLRGVSFRPIEAKAIVTGLEKDQVLELEREPTNAFDDNAIKVMYEGEHLGYVAKEVAAELATFMDQGIEYRAVVDLRMSPSVVSLQLEPVHVHDADCVADEAD